MKETCIETIGFRATKSEKETLKNLAKEKLLSVSDLIRVLIDVERLDRVDDKFGALKIKAFQDFIDIIEPDKRWLRLKDAAKILNCSVGKVKSLQDKGVLSLCYLPSGRDERKYRRVIINEVYELIAETRVLPKHYNLVCSEFSRTFAVNV